MLKTSFKSLKINLKSSTVTFQRSIINGPTKTGSNTIKKSPTKTSKNANDEGKKSSNSFLDSSFSFQLFLIVGAMGAGYTLGKTTILTSPPATLFPNESITPTDLLVEYEKSDKEIENKQYDMFRRCILRILESKGFEVDMKYGKNQSLYDEKYCNKEISDIMNSEDGLNDVFFGKDSKTWENKEFIWYPESTNDVSMILKYCNEFKIPVYTEDFGFKPKGLVFSIDYKYFQNSIKEKDSNIIKFNIGLSNQKINEILKENDLEYDINSSLRASDLFLMKCGIQLNDYKNRLINNKINKEYINGLECVLVDGSIMDLKKYSDDIKDDDSILYGIVSSAQEIICAITEVSLDKRKLELIKEDLSKNLIVIGSNELSKLNDTLKDIKGRVDTVKNDISLIDNNGCELITSTYGPYKTFAVLKLTDKELNKLNKRFTVNNSSNNNEENQNLKISRYDIKDIELDISKSVYYSSRVKSGDGGVILIKDNITDENSMLRTYHGTTPLIESEIIDYEDNSDENEYIKRAFLRRLKLAVDSNRVLNRNVGITVTYKGKN